MDVTVHGTRVTVAEFEAFCDLPENLDRDFQLIAGEIVEMPSNFKASKTSMLIGHYLLAYVLEHELGHVTGEAGGYMLEGDVYVPDAAFISYARQRTLSEKGFGQIPPDLAVEVVSADTSAENENLMFKLGTYLAVGTIVWIVRPKKKTVEVYIPGALPRIYSVDEMLDGGTVLPGFTLPVRNIFPVPPPETT